MHEIKRKTVRIDTDNQEELTTYDAILNDPLCNIIEKREIKLTDSEFNEEGKLARKWDRIIWIVTYEKRSLL